MGIALKRISAVALAAMLCAAVFAVVTPKADAGHEPANKLAAAGTETEVFGPGDAIPILSERMKVSSPSDLILSLTAECSIVTALRTGDDDQNGTDADTAEGKIDIWVEIDGKTVPVSSDDETEPGEVTFCNQVHQQRQIDSESNNPMDGVDTFDDYLRTKTANSFNWIALDTGVVYDDAEVDNGNNILDIVVYAELDDTTAATDACELGDKSCSEAIIGHRTLIAEPTNASVHEEVNAAGGAGN